MLVCYFIAQKHVELFLVEVHIELLAHLNAVNYRVLTKVGCTDHSCLLVC